MNYERILAVVAATPWAIEPNKGRELAGILSRRAAGEKASALELAVVAEARNDRQKRKDNAPKARGLAIIPIFGVMAQRASMFMQVSGLLSTEQIGLLVDQAADDPSVETIVLDIDSPGGSVFGVEELSQKVAAAAKRKKVIAIANSMAASAAFYVASQASELVVSPSAMIGSVGVVMMHIDESEALKMAGQVVTVVASTEKKAGGMDPGPLSEAWRSELEGLVAGYYDQFVRAVARGRGVSPSTVKQSFGQGGMMLAQAAVSVGAADRVGSLGNVLGELGFRFSTDGEYLVPTAKVTRPAPVMHRKSYSRDPETARRQEELDLDEETESRWRELRQEEEREQAVAANVHRRRLMLDLDRAPVQKAAPALTHDRDTIFCAWHEAGHSIAAVALGSRKVVPTIVPQEGNMGHVQIDWNGISPYSRAVVHAAGLEAEMLAPGFQWYERMGSDRGDRQDIESTCPKELQEPARRAAREMMSANKDKLAVLAGLLLQHHELEDAVVRAVVLG